MSDEKTYGSKILKLRRKLTGETSKLSPPGRDEATLLTTDSIAIEDHQQWVIQFASGRYFQNLKIDVGGPLSAAMTFSSREAIDEFMLDHTWIHRGGMSAQRIDTVAA